mmetsp:Transcript_97131/g.308123  ORF Transcript_97131/g.308123 Transcript_97131/m.308123 type:complete len:200 (+) Transcript_97131:347-946(+)
MPRIHTGPYWDSLSSVMKPTEHSSTVSRAGSASSLFRADGRTRVRVRTTYAAGGSSTSLPSSLICSTGMARRLPQSLRRRRARAWTIPTAAGGAARRLVPESTIAPQEGAQVPAPARPGSLRSVILTPQWTSPTTRSAWKPEPGRSWACTCGPTESQPGAPRPRSRQKAKLLICIAESMESAAPASSASGPKPRGTCCG